MEYLFPVQFSEKRVGLGDLKDVKDVILFVLLYGE
jgi:hypothetical protein